MDNKTLAIDSSARVPWPISQSLLVLPYLACTLKVILFPLCQRSAVSAHTVTQPATCLPAFLEVCQTPPVIPQSFSASAVQIQRWVWVSYLSCARLWINHCYHHLIVHSMCPQFLSPTTLNHCYTYWVLLLLNPRNVLKPHAAFQCLQETLFKVRNLVFC